MIPEVVLEEMVMHNTLDLDMRQKSFSNLK